jgi:hypothetical protein
MVHHDTNNTCCCAGAQLLLLLFLLLLLIFLFKKLTLGKKIHYGVGSVSKMLLGSGKTDMLGWTQ